MAPDRLRLDRDPHHFVESTPIIVGAAVVGRVPREPVDLLLEAIEPLLSLRADIPAVALAGRSCAVIFAPCGRLSGDLAPAAKRKCLIQLALPTGFEPVLQP